MLQTLQTDRTDTMRYQSNILRICFMEIINGPKHTIETT